MLVLPAERTQMIDPAVYLADELYNLRNEVESFAAGYTKTAELVESLAETLAAMIVFVEDRIPDEQEAIRDQTIDTIAELEKKRSTKGSE